MPTEPPVRKAEASATVPTEPPAQNTQDDSEAVTWAVVITISAFVLVGYGMAYGRWNRGRGVSFSRG